MGGSYLFDRHDTDLPRIALVSLVTKIKNVGRKAKPFHTILETPDTAGFWQKINKTPNKAIDRALALIAHLIVEPDSEERGMVRSGAAAAAE